MPKSWQLSRRTFLRGTGAAIALPWLDAMAGSAVAAAAPATTTGAGASATAGPPTRLACLFFPNGVWRKTWIPEKAGADYDLPFALEPLAKHRKDFTILSGLDKANSRGGDGHYAKTANWLTGLEVRKTTGKEINVGHASMDQVVAQRVGHLTPLPSLELGIDPVVSGIDSFVGYTRLYASHVSWRSAGEPVAKEINPRLAFERLFGAKTETGKPTSGTPAGDRQSLLDLTLEDAADVRKKLGRDDQFKLDEYLESVRAVEKRVAFFAKTDPRTWHPTPPEKVVPPGAKPPADYREHVKLMLDLIVLGFRTDTTRVASFMFANCVSPRNFSFVDGVKGGHHDISHHSNKDEKIEQYKRINRWHASQLAYVIEQMRAVREGEGTLLDHTMVLFGSSMSDGNAHDPNNLPILLAGGAGGTLNGGRHVASDKGTPLCNLYVSMLDRLGCPVERFGDSTGPLKGL
ncbi:MAG TPA: DUF1552 domain-containing protein [Humisphaera sp.]